MTTNADAIARLRAALGRATPRPWWPSEDADVMVGDPGEAHRVATTESTRYEADGVLICAAVNALPALLDVAEAARALQGGDTLEDDDPRWHALHLALAKLEGTR